MFDETPLGKRREAQAEKMGWYEGNPSFGRVRPPPPPSSSLAGGGPARSALVPVARGEGGRGGLGDASTGESPVRARARDAGYQQARRGPRSPHAAGKRGFEAAFPC